MKRLSVLILALLLFGSCSSKLDKKFDVKSAKEDIEDIKKKYSDQYTQEDFEQIGKELFGKAITAAFAGEKFEDGKGIKIDKTYRAILDSAKAKRLVYEDKLKAFKIDSTKFTNLISINVDSARYLKKSDYYEEYYLVWITGKNNSGKEVAAFEGEIKFADALDKVLLDANLKSLETLKPNEIYKQDGAYDLNLFNTENDILKSVPFSKLKTKWNLKNIVYADGTKLQAPEEPIK